jgi:hypothetical protein
VHNQFFPPWFVGSGPQRHLPDKTFSQATSWILVLLVSPAMRNWMRRTVDKRIAVSAIWDRLSVRREFHPIHSLAKVPNGKVSQSSSFFLFCAWKIIAKFLS